MALRDAFSRHLKWPLVAAAFWLAFIAWPPLTGSAQDNLGPNVPQVQTMRITQEGTGTASRTRIVLSFDKAVDHRWFTLNQPARVVVDFPAVQFVTQPSLVDIPQGGMLKGMRAGLFRPGVVRMVIDLAAKARVSVFPIPAGGSQGPRLIVDIAALKPGQQPTEVAPPTDVITSVAWAPPGAAPVVQVPGLENGTRSEVANPSPTDNQSFEKPAAVVPPKVVQNLADGRPQGPLVVTLDAGHGGVDPGACSNGMCEKYLTLDMVKRVGALLQKEGIKIIYTRSTDQYIPLGDRSRIAERAQANLFVSLHADSHPDREVQGATVYMVSEKASDREAERLADAENAGDVLAGVGFENESREVQGILISLVQRDTLNNSSYLARSVLERISAVTEVRKPDPLFAGFKVLKAPDVPSILVEMGYITSPREQRKLETMAYRQKLATAIAQGIKNYLEHYVHLQAPAAIKTADNKLPGIAPAAGKPKKTRKHVKR